MPRDQTQSDHCYCTAPSIGGRVGVSPVNCNYKGQAAMNEEKQEGKPHQEGRRQFLGTSVAAITGLMIAPGVQLIDLAAARPGEVAASNQVRWGMLIDTNNCDSGCTDCVTACNTENGLSGGTLPTDSQWIRKIEMKMDGKEHSHGTFHWLGN